MTLPTESSRRQEAAVDFEYRQPENADAAEMLDLVHESGALEPNSCYAYLLMCREFSQSSVVALDGRQLVGFVTGIIPPDRPDALFVWQIGVRASARRQGLAQQMLNQIFQRRKNSRLKYLEATVTPDNVPSRRMFESFAKSRQAEFEYHDWFQASDFGSQSHEPEQLIRIGPFSNASTDSNTGSRPNQEDKQTDEDI